MHRASDLASYPNYGQYVSLNRECVLTWLVMLHREIQKSQTLFLKTWTAGIHYVKYVKIRNVLLINRFKSAIVGKWLMYTLNKETQATQKLQQLQCLKKAYSLFFHSACWGYFFPTSLSDVSTYGSRARLESCSFYIKCDVQVWYCSRLPSLYFYLLD